MAYVYAFIGFALLIVLHEAGHFAAAKAVGMRVERFSLFFGPMFVKKTIGETDYGIGMVPLGGYVKITGMARDEVYETPEIEARAYINQPVWKRIVVIAAGPAVNFVLAFLLLSVYFLGQQHPLSTPKGQPVALSTIGAVIVNTPAAHQLQGGDVLVSVDGIKGSPDRLHRQIETHTCAGGVKVNGCRAVTPAKIVVRRDGKLQTYEIRPEYEKADREMLVGFEFLDKYVNNTLLYSAGASVSGLWNATTLTVSDLAQIFKKKDRDQFHSVVGVYHTTAVYFNAGFGEGFRILALISLSLAIINLFPFLPLDGGHIFWAVAEKIRGRRIPWVVMERAGLVGFALIIVLFAIGLSNDIASHFNAA